MLPQLMPVFLASLPVFAGAFGEAGHGIAAGDRLHGVRFLAAGPKPHGPAPAPKARAAAPTPATRAGGQKRGAAPAAASKPVTTAIAAPSGKQRAAKGGAPRPAKAAPAGRAPEASVGDDLLSATRTAAVLAQQLQVAVRDAVVSEDARKDQVEADADLMATAAADQRKLQAAEEATRENARLKRQVHGLSADLQAAKVRAARAEKQVQDYVAKDKTLEHELAATKGAWQEWQRVHAGVHLAPGVANKIDDAGENETNADTEAYIVQDKLLEGELTDTRKAVEKAQDAIEQSGTLVSAAAHPRSRNDAAVEQKKHAALAHNQRALKKPKTQHNNADHPRASKAQPMQRKKAPLHQKQHQTTAQKATPAVVTPVALKKPAPQTENISEDGADDKDAEDRELDATLEESDADRDGPRANTAAPVAAQHQPPVRHQPTHPAQHPKAQAVQPTGHRSHSKAHTAPMTRHQDAPVTQKVELPAHMTPLAMNRAASAARHAEQDAEDEIDQQDAQDEIDAQADEEGIPEGEAADDELDADADRTEDA